MSLAEETGDWDYAEKKAKELKKIKGYEGNVNLSKYTLQKGVIHLEKNNLIETHLGEAKKIETLLHQFNSEQKEPLFPSAFEAPIMIDKYDGQTYEEGDEYIYWSN